ncbi:MAG: indole-3-glycerol phosphate synthase TrpC [Cellvibrionaceae bacterium]
MNKAPTVLQKIIDRKFEEVAERQSSTSIDQLYKLIEEQSEPRGFVQSIENKLNSEQAAVIAEIKKASPSKGLIREDFFPAEIAKSYEKGNAACISVLTDVDFFQGSDAYLKEVKAASKLPVLRKDFMVDEYQIVESRAIGADCILLIVAALELDKMEQLNKLAIDLGLDVLVEVHNSDELEQAMTLNNKLIGINNRNLKTFDVNLETTFSLLDKIPENRIVVTESGIHSSDDIAAMRGHDVHTFLVGESLMKADDPGIRLMEMFS